MIFLISISLFLSPIVVRSEDVDDGEDAVVNEEAPAAGEDAVQGSADEEGLVNGPVSSPFVKTNVLFVQPESTDLPAGRLVKMLVGFYNNGTSGFLVQSIDGAFRYPQDFSYYIQNFTTFDFNKVIEPDREATFEYYFTPSETFSSRQFGLTINVNYRALDDKQYVNTVFNETVNIVEPEEGLDGETFFLYIFLAAIVVLLLVVLQQVFSGFKKKTRSSKSSYVHKLSNGNGTSTNSNDVDLEWIPKEHLQQNKSPRTSPRQRKARNGVPASGNSSNDEQ